MASSQGNLLEVRDLSVRYRGRRNGLFGKKMDVLAVDRVTLTVEKGRTLGLVGETGSGKSTIARVVLGMVEPTTGSVAIDGQVAAELRSRDRRALRRLVQIVPQDPYSSLDPRMTIYDIIAEPLTGGFPGRGRSAETRSRVSEMLRLVGLPSAKAKLHPHQFSGGQRQRIALARALAPRPDLVVLDEPTSALDVSVRAQILNLLRAIQAELNVTYLVISHDLVTVSYLASTVAVMHRGRIVEIGTTAALYDAPLHPYTLELLSSVPGAGGGFLRQAARAVSTAVLPSTACKFANRCPRRARLGNPERCETEEPALLEVDPDHRVACHFPNALSSEAT